MPKLSMFMICDAINNVSGPDNKMVPILIAPKVGLDTPFLPNSLSFGITAGIRDLDLGAGNTVRCTIKAPDGTQIYDSGASDFPPARRSGSPVSRFEGAVICMDVRNLLVKDEGEYIFVITVNGKQVGKHEIPIYKEGQT